MPAAVRSSFGPKPVQPFGHLSEISHSLHINLRGVRWKHKCCPTSLQDGDVFVLHCDAFPEEGQLRTLCSGICADKDQSVWALSAHEVFSQTKDALNSHCLS